MNSLFISILYVFLIHQSYSRILPKDVQNNKLVIKQVGSPRAPGAPGDLVKVDVYYENLNKVNRKFFVEQFRPVIDDLWDIIDLQLIPFGTTVKVSDTEFNCPFGEKQCWANRIQACAIGIAAQSPDDPIAKKGTALFTQCIFKNKEFSDIYDLGPHCATQELVDEWTEIDICEKGSVGNTYYNQNEVKTTAIKDNLNNGLAVAVNTVFGAENTDNLVKAVCDSYTPTSGQEKPKRCENTEKAEKVKVGIYYETQNLLTGNYFNRQIKPFYHILEDIVDIDLIPYGNTKHESSSDVNTFTCETTDQCIANKIHAIVVNDFIINSPDGDEIDGPNRAINFIDCMTSHTKWQNIYTAGEQCANIYLTADDWIHLLTTAQSSDSDPIFLQMKEKTEKVGENGVLTRVPFVTINEVPSIPTLNDFTQEVCAKYTGIKPSVCTRIAVNVYYEALNHKSRKFIIEELRPAFNHFQNLIDLNLIPAGRAHRDPDHGGFTCPGGIDQCDGNKLEACVIDNYWNDGQNWTDPIRQEVMEFLYCMTKNKHAIGVWRAAEQCSEQNIETDPWPSIFMCMHSGNGDAILDEYIEETQSSGIDINSQTIPVITIDGKVRTDANQDLIAVLCEHFDEDHRPDKCTEGKAPKLEIGVYYESMSELSKNFITKQLGLNYKHIEEMVDIQLYPNGNVDDGGNTDGKCATQMDSCVANKIQSIVIDWLWLSDDDGDQIDGSIRTTHFLECVFSHSEWKNDYLKAGKYCADTYLPNDDWIEILVELNTTSGDEIYKKVQEKTKELKDKIGSNELSFVPYVTLNGAHSLRTANDLLQTVCDVYTGEKPLECTPVIVEIYYETLNAQSRKFFLEELRPVFEDIRESFTLDLIPYGRTEMIADAEDQNLFECPNGEQQCLGNKIQACAIKHFLHSDDNLSSDQYDGKNQTLSFITCMFKNVDNMVEITDTAEKCANQHFIEDVWIGEILMCAKTEEGTTIMKEMAAKTQSLKDPLEHSPWIVINGERVGVAQNQFQEVICDRLLGDRPEVCEEQRASKVKIEVHYQTADPSVQKYIINELYPSYRDVEEIIDLEVIPFGQTIVNKGDDGSYEFICPQGDNECIGNKLHTCVYDYFWKNDDDPISDNMDVDGKLQTLEFIKCYFSNENWPTDPWTSAEQCVNNIFIDMWPTIEQCVKSGEIDPFFAQLGEKVSALSPPLIYTPWVTVNGKHSKPSEQHFTRAVCDAYQGRSKPWACYASVPSPVKPTVEIHYEPLNTQSQSFVVSQLDHLKTHVDEIVTLDVLPFGRAVRNGDVFQCPNDDDCHTFKLHACIIDRFLKTSPVPTLNFLICAFGSDMTNVPKVTEDCLNENFVDSWPQIDTCATHEGNQLLGALADKVDALNPKLSHIPWIIVNGEHNLEAEDNLIQEICDTFYPTDKPSQCIPELLPVAINYQSMSDSVKEFFSKQLKPIELYFDEIASIDLVSYGLTKRSDPTSDEFTCPEGEVQCNANKVHACVLNTFYDKENHENSIDIEESRYRTVQFLLCAFNKSTSDPISDAEICLNQEMGGDYWSTIDTCAHGDDGTELYKAMAVKTEALNPTLTSVPWVTINGSHTSESQTNLIQTICQSYPSVRPYICSSLGKESVDIGIFYTSDQKSSDWVLNQLKQFYADSTPTRAQSLQSILSTSLTPWGKTQYTEGADEPFICPNGANECLANRIHACAINQYSNEPKGWQHITEFLICFFSNSEWTTNPAEAGNQCANKVWFLDPWPAIEVCATQNTAENIAVYLQMRDKTVQTNADYFPWITVKNVHNTDAEDNLLGTVCDNYSGIKPEGCSATQTEGPTDGPTPDGSTPDGQTPDGQTPDGQTPDGSTASPTKDPNDGAMSLTIANCLFIIMSLILFL